MSGQLTRLTGTGRTTASFGYEERKRERIHFGLLFTLQEITRTIFVVVPVVMLHYYQLHKGGWKSRENSMNRVFHRSAVLCALTLCK